MDISQWNAGWQLWDLISFLNETRALSSRAMFRGHSNANWKLVPALYRRPVHIFGPQSQAELYVHAEERMLDTFFDRAVLLLPHFARNGLVDRVVAQHYGVPTQLLDWTLDPFIALFFAVSDDAQREADGALYFASAMQRYHSNSPVSFPYTGRLATLIPPVLDTRISAQKSVFTIQSFGAEAAFVALDDRELKFSAAGQGSDPQDEVSSFGKVVIPSDRKQQILGQLLDMGVDASLVFPGLQGIGERIATHAKLKNYGGDGLF